MTYLPQNQLAPFREKNKPCICPILLESSDDWVVDHDHQTGLIRGVISRKGNSFLGKVENYYLNRCSGDKAKLPEVLRGMAYFIENPPASEQRIMHPVGLKQLTNRFKRNLSKHEQEVSLRILGAKKSEISSCKNVNERAALYRSLVKDQFTKL